MKTIYLLKTCIYIYMCESMKKDAARQKYVFLWSSFVVYLSLSGMLVPRQAYPLYVTNSTLTLSCQCHVIHQRRFPVLMQHESQVAERRHSHHSLVNYPILWFYPLAKSAKIHELSVRKCSFFIKPQPVSFIIHCPGRCRSQNMY